MPFIDYKVYGIEGQTPYANTRQFSKSAQVTLDGIHVYNRHLAEPIPQPAPSYVPPSAPLAFNLPPNSSYFSFSSPIGNTERTMPSVADLKYKKPAENLIIGRKYYFIDGGIVKKGILQRVKEGDSSQKDKTTAGLDICYFQNNNSMILGDKVYYLLSSDRDFTTNYYNNGGGKKRRKTRNKTHRRTR